jgi:cytochrome c553
VHLLKTLIGLRGVPRIAAIFSSLGVPLLISSAYLQPSSQPPVRVPSYVSWTGQTIAAATRGDAVRGLVIARRCERCHGIEGFSADPLVPNLAGMDKLTIWKQLNDFQSGKRESRLMQPIAAALSVDDYADLAAYFSMLPTYADPQDTRAFPEALPVKVGTAEAGRLIVGGDGKRGIPPCQACHGPIGHKTGAPSLMTQNAAYIQEELEEFAESKRANDINMPMRSVASQLTKEERQGVAAYYGAGLGILPSAMYLRSR